MASSISPAPCGGYCCSELRQYVQDREHNPPADLTNPILPLLHRDQFAEKDHRVYDAELEIVLRLASRFLLSDALVPFILAFYDGDSYVAENNLSDLKRSGQKIIDLEAFLEQNPRARISKFAKEEDEQINALSRAKAHILLEIMS